MDEEGLRTVADRLQKVADQMDQTSELLYRHSGDPEAVVQIREILHIQAETIRSNGRIIDLIRNSSQ